MTLTATDQFCGAGGSSIGATVAGVELRLAMNHWKLAVETHNSNFPDADHACVDVSATDPRRYPTTDILITSPECTNHSIAKGTKRRQREMLAFDDLPPESDAAAERSRATMWDVPRFAEYHRYKLIVVENVVDVAYWTPFPAWLHAMETLGYKHKPVYLNSMFVRGVPQSRDRVYFIFWRSKNRAPDLDFRPQSWCQRCEKPVAGIQTWKNPAKAWGRYRAQYFYRCPECHQIVLPYVEAAATAIDWTLKGERIGDRNRPLAPATIERIQAGIAKYWTRHQIVALDHLSTLKTPTPIDDPWPTQTGRQDKGLLVPFLTHMRGTDPRQAASSTRSIEEPMGTVTSGGGHHSLIEGPEPLYLKMFGGEVGYPVSHPLGAVTAVDHHALLNPPLIDVQRTNGRVRSAEEPLATMVAGTTGHALLTPPFIAPMDHRGPNRHNTSRSVYEPTRTMITAQVDALIEPPDREAFLTAYYGQGSNSEVQEPMPTIATRDRFGLVEGPAIEVDDCSFRMLEPHEIGRAMAFPTDYKVLGNKRERVRQFGNAVTPPAMKLLIERCVESLA